MNNNKILNYILGFFIFILIILPYIIIYFILKKNNQKLQLYPEIKIVKITNENEIDSNLLEEALMISSKILDKIKKN